MRPMRLSIVGFGTVGRWLVVAIDRRRSWLAAECGVAVSLVGVATRRDGFIYRDAGNGTANHILTLIVGPGAGREQARQGMFADLVAIAQTT